MRDELDIIQSANEQEHYVYEHKYVGVYFIQDVAVRTIRMVLEEVFKCLLDTRSYDIM